MNRAGLVPGNTCIIYDKGKLNRVVYYTTTRVEGPRNAARRNVLGFWFSVL